MEPTETPSVEQLETFPNPRPGRDFTIEIVCPEFTSVCPKTGQPDFGTITFTYTPGETCVELKSLKLYLQRFRNQGIFYEQVTNRLLDDFVAACKPVRCKVVSTWTPRRDPTSVTCSYEAGVKAGHGGSAESSPPRGPLCDILITRPLWRFQVLRSVMLPWHPVERVA